MDRLSPVPSRYSTIDKSKDITKDEKKIDPNFKNRLSKIIRQKKRK